MREHQIHMSNSPREQMAKAPPPLFSQGAGSAGISIPSAHEGECSLTKGEGSGAPKGAGNISNALRRTPNDVGRSPRGAPLRRFSLDPGTAFWKRTGAPFTTALDSEGLSPRVHPLHQPVAGRTHVVGPGSGS